jgi:hypothetical protein
MMGEESLLRDILLGALGGDSDLNWALDKDRPSPIDIGLMAPGAAAITRQMGELGADFVFLESLCQEPLSNPLTRSLATSLEAALNSYVEAIVSLDQQILVGTIATLTGLFAALEPYRDLLRGLRRVLPSVFEAVDIDKFNKLRSIKVVARPSLQHARRC